MDKPICLDLYGRKGGAARGYQRAGFYVISNDIDPQPGNPAEECKQMDALKLLAQLLRDGFIASVEYGLVRPALISASPPCQGQNTATASNRARGIEDDHPSLVAPTRELLDQIGIPYVIEQPTASVKGTIRRDLTLCMDMFKGDMPPPWVQKHRSFEVCNWPAAAWARVLDTPRHLKHAGYVRGHRHGVVRSGAEAPYVAGYGKGGGKATAEELRHAMQIDWMTDRFDLCEAIPPAYSEWIGRAFLNGQSAASAPEMIKAPEQGILFA